MERFSRCSSFFLSENRTVKSALVMLVVFIFSCGYSQTDYVYELPERLDDGWEVSSLSTEGMATDKIARLTNQIKNNKFQEIHSLLIVKNGKLVHEAYFSGFDREKARKRQSQKV